MCCFELKTQEFWRNCLHLCLTTCTRIMTTTGWAFLPLILPSKPHHCDTLGWGHKLKRLTNPKTWWDIPRCLSTIYQSYFSEVKRSLTFNQANKSIQAFPDNSIASLLLWLWKFRISNASSVVVSLLLLLIQCITWWILGSSLSVAQFFFVHFDSVAYCCCLCRSRMFISNSWDVID